MESSVLRDRLLIGLCFAAIWLVWGSTYLIIAIAIETIPPFAMAGTRFAAAGLLVLAWARLRGAPWPSPVEWRGASLVGGLMLCGGNGLVTWAEQTVPSSVAALLITTVPMWMTLLDGLVYGGARPRPRTWFGLVLGFAGVVVLVRPTEDDLGALPLAGSMALLLAAFSWANGSLLSRQVRLPRSPAMAVGAEMLTAGGLLWIASLARGEGAALDPASISARSALSLAFLVLFGSIVALSAYMYLLRRVTASSVSTYAFVNPVVAVALGWYVAGEPITARVLGAGSMIVVAVGVILLGGWRRRAVRVPSAVPDVEGRAQAGERQAHAEA